MASLVDTQINFVDALKQLIELDYDAAGAYDAAINKITNEEYRKQLQIFRDDHKKHIEELNILLFTHGEEPVASPNVKQWLTKGKVILANPVEDDAILKAMLTNEDDTNTAYERLNEHPEKWTDAEEVLKHGLADERIHKQWIEETIGKAEF